MSLTNILSPEDKKYLRFFSKYLQSYGEKVGTFRYEDFNDNEWKAVLNNTQHIDENFYLDIPVQINPIISKILKNIVEETDYGSFDEECNYYNVNLIIDTRDSSIFVEESCQYTIDDPIQLEFSLAEDPDDKGMEECFQAIIDLNVDGEYVVNFSGYGDSGSIEGDYPAPVEDWCYRIIEGNFGGWEINEGSHGEFTFNVNNGTVILDFNWHNEETETNTLYEEKFDK